VDEKKRPSPRTAQGTSLRFKKSDRETENPREVTVELYTEERVLIEARIIGKPSIDFKGKKSVEPRLSP